MVRKASLILAVCAILFAGRASADTITLSIDTPNAALSGFIGPYETVVINRTSSTTADFTITANTVGGNTYLIGDGGIFGFNSNDPITLSNFSWTGGNGSTAIPINVSSNNEDGFGNFTYSIDSFDGFTSAVSQLKFTATLTSGSWAAVGDILDPNSLGHLVAAHVFVASTACTGACVTGFGSDGGGGNAQGQTAAVPEPASLLLLGSGLALAARRVRRKQDR
jgi:hypothetical protein